MNIKRYAAGVMALALLASGPYSNPALFRAKAAETVTSATLMFESGQSAYTMEDDNFALPITVTKPSYYTENTSSTNGIKITKPATPSVDTSKVAISSTTGDNKSVLVQDGFFTAPDTGDGQKITLTLQGDYVALLKEGTVLETGGGTSTMHDFKVTSSTQLSVFQDSTITLTCTRTESAGVSPTFSVSLPTGTAFTGVTDAFANPRSDQNQPLKVSMAGAAGRLFEIEFTPQVTYETDEGGSPLVPSNRWIQKGTTFTLQVPAASSSAVLLNVYSPRAAAKDVINSISTQSGVVGEGRDYIRFAEGDARAYIRQNFQVSYGAAWYNTKFYLSWSWETGDPDNASMLAFTSAPSGFQNVTVTRRQTDVSGNLVVKVFREMGHATDDTKALQTLKIPITIKGYGTPPSLEQESRWLSSNTEVGGQYPVTEEKFPSTDRQVPGTIYLDAYDGHLLGVDQPDRPSQYKLQLNMGRDGGTAVHAVVESEGGEELVELQTLSKDPSNPGGLISSDYSFGSEIDNLSRDVPGDEGLVYLVITPKKTGVRSDRTVTVKITFYEAGADGRPIPVIDRPKEFRLTVADNSPSSDATLKDLVVKQKVPGGAFGYSWPELDFGFNPATPEYTVEVANKVEAIKLTPTRNDPYAHKMIEISAKKQDNSYVTGWAPGSPGVDANGFVQVESGQGVTPEIPLSENEMVKIQIRVTAEDTTTKLYSLNIMRKPKSTDATLKALSLTDQSGNLLFDDIQYNVFEYNVEVPYKSKMAKVLYEFNDENAQDPPVFNPALERSNPLNPFEKPNWLNLLKKFEGADSGGATRQFDFTIKTTAEDGVSVNNYVLHITRADPSEVNTLAELKVLNAADKSEQAFSPAFTPGMAMEEGDNFELRVQYIIEKLQISAKPTDSGSTVLLLGEGIGGSLIGNIVGEPPGWVEIAPNTPTKSFTPPPYDPENEEGTYYTALVEVWPESLSMVIPDNKDRPQNPGDVVNGISYEVYMEKVMRYPIHIYREPPSTDATLKSIDLADQDGNVIPFLDFDPEVLSYSIEVPYEVKTLQVTPTATNEFVERIVVNNKRGKSGSTFNVKLNETTTTVTIEVFPQDTTAPTMTYTIYVKRLPPSSDARLIKLEVENGVDFKPVFAPNRTSYTCGVAEGAEGVRITATPNHAGAKITIDGVRVENGKPSELIRILEQRQVVKIVVTAQDGRTTMTYTIRFTNENIMDKSSNADLAELEVSPGVMRPVAFKPAVTEYEVSVSEETFDVELFPVPADSRATMRVFQDTREIGDDDGNYGGFIQDGENEFTIEVTAPDESKVKTYTVLVYRNEEDKMGTLETIKAEDIDFENSPNPIIVDITKYTRIDRDVFEELKKYPEKAIIFQGNDYSLRFDAKDLQKVIPNTDIFDFGLSFKSPLEEEIKDEIYFHSGNSKGDYVFVYFKHHGALPGPATFTLSLGRKYRNKTIYWHYYNEERERIDYYGYVKTNSRGTFALILDHLSTYIAGTRRINGSENRSGAIDTNLGDMVDRLNSIPNTGKGRRGRR